MTQALAAQADQLKNMREFVGRLSKQVEDMHRDVRTIYAQKQPAPVFYEPRPVGISAEDYDRKRQDVQRRAREYDKWSEAQRAFSDCTIESWITAKNPAEQSKADVLNGLMRSAIGGIAKARSGGN